MKMGRNLEKTRTDERKEVSDREEDTPKVLKRDVESFTDTGAQLSIQIAEEYRADLEDKGIYSGEQIETMVKEKRDATVQEMAQDYVGCSAEEHIEKYLFGWGKAEVNETKEEVADRLEECGVRNVELSGVLEKYQETFARNVEEMCESYPELKGYIGSIRAVDLEDHVLACAGPQMDKDGFSTEIQVNRKIYSREGAESRIAKLQQPNWRGEAMLAGQGEDAILKHEMAHILHLRMLAEERGLEIGSHDILTYREVQEDYKRNMIVSRMCADAYCKHGGLTGDKARIISIYGASDLGECFAEAISEYETRENPRPFATEVYNNYQRRIHENDDYTA